MDLWYPCSLYSIGIKSMYQDISYSVFMLNPCSSEPVLLTSNPGSKLVAESPCPCDTWERAEQIECALGYLQ